jgi:hypothetical protein
VPKKKNRLLVFVHGWSVTHTNTYGGLPERLVAETEDVEPSFDVRHLYLGRYVSFRDEVRLEDVSRAFEVAVRRELLDDVEKLGRFACITHSTGGPVVRDWWYRYYRSAGRAEDCPMSHLVMLAPANFGSALAQLGKARVSRLKSWFEGVEPGTGVLDWLELGSPEAWDLNRAWIDESEGIIGPKTIFPFVVTGQSIDRKFYDHLNSYTGEAGSDGVVRVTAANLNAGLVRLAQADPSGEPDGATSASRLELADGGFVEAPKTAVAVVSGTAHSGARMGIMRSVSAKRGARKGAELVNVVLSCLSVATRDDYRKRCDDFGQRTTAVQDAERVEVDGRWVLSESYFVHDRYSMVIFRVTDDAGHAVEDFDLVLTAGADDDPNMLPRGFVLDRQRNRRHPGTITYYFNHDVMSGCEPVVHKKRTLREGSPGAQMLGLRIEPRPRAGFVHYLPCSIRASAELLERALRENQTTLVEIVLRRVVHEGVFGLDRGPKTASFKKVKPGPVL